MTIRVLVVDDQALVRKGFRMILDAENDLDVAGEASDGEEAIQRSRSLRPDVILMDVRMPGTDGIAATASIVSAQPTCRVLILTTFDEDEYAFAGLRAGASGFLLKDVTPAELASAIRIVHRGDAVVAPRMTRRLLDTFAHQLPTSSQESADLARAVGLDRLTEREREVLVAVAGGHSNSEIADLLFVSEATVKSHVGRILTKLELRDRVQAAVLAFQVGLVKPLTDI